MAIIGNGFRRAGADDAVTRLIVAISGLEKQGKTHFALTAPGPIALFNLDVGLEGVSSKFVREGKSVFVYDVGRTQSPNEAKIAWAELVKAYTSVLANKSIRTVVLDTATEVWEMLRLARFGKLAQVMPFQYGPVNAEYRALLRAAYTSDKNLVLLHKMKVKYVNDKRTGDYERSGFSDTGFIVQMNCEVFRDEDGFNLSVLDCRHNPEMMGDVLTGPLCSFKYLAVEALGQTRLEDWED